MTPVATWRLMGPAQSGPAPFSFLLAVFATLSLLALAGCSERRDVRHFQGTAFNSGYHITLYADLDEAEHRRLQADIQSEVERMEAAMRGLRGVLELAGRNIPQDITSLGAPETMLALLIGVLHGHGADALAGWLERQHHERYLVELGGDVRVGAAPSGRPWRLALEQPTNDGRSHSRIVELEHNALATAGDFRDRPDRVTDIPLRLPFADSSRLVEVKVIHSSALMASAWANALLALPPYEAIELVKQRSISAYFIVSGPLGYEVASSPLLVTRFD